MLALNFGVVFLYIILLGEETKQVQSVQVHHSTLFFSGPLEDKLGVYEDQQKVTLTCNGGSKNPQPGTSNLVTYKWLRNGRELHTYASNSRLISTVQGDLIIYPSEYDKDDGNYQCRITDATPEKWSLLSNTAELRLAYVSGVQKDLVTSYGEPGKGWKYIFSGYKHSKYPKPKFIWKFRRAILKETDKISISEDGNLYIAELSNNNAGTYSFELESKSLKQKRESVKLQIVGSTSSSDILATFMLGPKSKTVGLKREKEVTFECFATGKPMPTISWKKNGRTLKKDSKYDIKDFNKRLTIRDLKTSDSAKYQCAITRAAVKSVWEAILTVIAPPTIESIQPQDQIGHIGNYTIVTCIVKGSFASGVHFSLSWYRNGVRLRPDSRITMRKWSYPGFQKHTLNVTRLQKVPDGGMYQCFARNDGGEGMKYTAIDVQSLPPNITFGPGIVYAVLGRPAKIVCIARGSPPMTFTWEKAGRALSDGKNGNNGTYVINNVQKSDVAQYTCIAKNGPDPNIDVAKSTGRLEIVGETVVVNRSSKVYAPKGSHRYLYCGVRYDPKVNVTYKWYFKNQLVKTDGAREVTWNGQLIIKGVHQGTGGIYRCESRSAVGDYSTTVELIVQSPPFRTTIPKVDNVRQNSVRLLWRAGYDGNSAIQYFSIGIKYANGTTAVFVERAMPSGDIKKYVVTGLTPSTEYQFGIQAWNSVGKSEWSGWSTAVKTLEAPPSYKLKKVTGSAVNDDTIEVKWEEPPKSSHNGILRGYYVAWKYAGVTSGKFTTKKVTPATTRVLRITHLILNSPYEVKVQMFNDAGPGPYSDPTVIRTKEGIPSSAPREFAVRNVSTRSVVLQWNSPPQQDWNGELKSYNIRFWVFGHEDDAFDQRNAPHDKSAFIQVFNVTNLKTYTQYEFKISAHNSVGGGPEAGPVGVKTTEDAPSAPRDLSIVDQFSDTISVEWHRPREVNGVLTGYVVKYWRVGHKNEEKVETVPGYELQAGITSLRSNTRYKIEVAAKTRAGESKSASIVGRTLDIPVRPSAPSVLRFLEINATAIELTWKEGSKGRSPIIKYIVEGNNETGFANDKTSTWFDALIIKDPFKKHNVPPVIIEDLHPAVLYRFRVRAYNKVGSSPLSSISSDVKTANAAPWSPPLNVRVHSDDLNAGELQLTWELPPKETWNSPYISYAVELVEVGPETEFQQNRTSRGIFRELKAFTVPSLKKFTAYKIRMWTESTIYGRSPYSPTIIGQTSEYVPDLAPDDIRAIGSTGSSIKITWGEVPKEGRNGAVLGYKLFYRLVQYAPQHYKEINVGNIKSYVLENLIGYTQYDIRLSAFTKIGDGKRSDALRPYARTLETLPGPPSRLRFPTIDASLVAVSWDIPERMGGNITMYRVRHKPRDEVGAVFLLGTTLASTRRSDIVTSLRSDKFYIFEVQARISIGWGDAARATVFTTGRGNKGKAETPLILPISDSNITSRSIAIRWAVVTRRQQPIRFFTLQYRKGAGAWITHLKPLQGDERKLVVWGLEPNHMYTFRIRSTIDADVSPFSTPSPPVRTLMASIGGTPRNVRITSNSSTTLIVDWEPPFLVETQATVYGYRLGYELHRTNPSQVANYSDRILLASYRKYMFTGLKEFTLYDIRLNAIDDNHRNMRSYEETRRTAARLPPTPSFGRSPSVGQTSVIIYWNKQSSKKTSIMGYKAVYENPTKRRRRRAVSEHCDTAEPGEAYFSNTSTKGTITNLAMYTSYRIVLHSFNSAGDSKGSKAVHVKTKEGVPGPPEKFDFDGVYGNEVHLYWEPPCERNGLLTGYTLTVSTDIKGKIQEKYFGSGVEDYKVLGLAILTKYKFELVAKTSQGAGFPKILETTTLGPPVLPSPPKNVRGRAENNVVTLVWKDGSHGNIPILVYKIQYRTSERTPWVEGWNFGPSDINKNRTDRTLWVVLKDLKPVTQYWFRIVVRNKLGASPPSDPSDSILTGESLPVARKTPIYEKIWFIAVMAVLGFLILILLILCIVLVCRRRSRRGGKRISHPALEMSIQRSQGLRPYSSIEDNLSNGDLKSKEEKHLVDESDEEVEGDDNDDNDYNDDEEQASSLETKSDVSEDGSEDDIPTKKREIKAALQEQDKYYPHSKPPRSFSTDNVHGSPPPAYATYASRRMNARSEPFLDPFNEFGDDDDKALRRYQSPFDRPPSRRSPQSGVSPYDGDSSDSSEIQKRKRGDPRSSSFRRALISGNPEPEPERPIENEREPERRPKPTPRKYRSLEKAVNDSAKPPSYEYDDDDDDDNIEVQVRQPGMSQRNSLPPEYRSDSGRDSSDDHDRVPLNQQVDPPERSESPAPTYHSSTDDSLDNPDRQRLVESNPRPEPEISSYSSFV